jgi:hypothetical protein
VREVATAAREAARRWGEAGGAGEPPESLEGSAQGSGVSFCFSAEVDSLRYLVQNNLIYM